MSLHSSSLTRRRVRHEARHEDGRDAWQVAPRELVRIAVPRREGRLLQPIEDESGLEKGAAKLVQGSVKVPMRLRLTGHPGSLPRWYHQVVAQLHGVPRDLHPIVASLCLRAKAHGVAVEGGVLHGEDEPPTRR